MMLFLFLEEQADLELNCLQYYLHLMDELLRYKTKLFNSRTFTVII